LTFQSLQATLTGKAQGELVCQVKKTLSVKDPARRN
jgi:hypothetical protein